MNEQTAAMLGVLHALDGSLSLQVDAILSLLSDDNVDVLIAAMPSDFRHRFIAWMQSKYRSGNTVTIGPRTTEIPTVGILAMKHWLDRHGYTSPTSAR